MFKDLIAAEAPKANFKNFLKYYFTHPEFKVVFYYRLYSKWYQNGGMVKKIFSKILWLINVKNSACYISPKSNIGMSLRLPHATGIVIGDNVKIGNNCIIYQNVTIGKSKSDDYPVIGNNVTIYAGSVLIGKIKIGDNVIIGANSVVNKNVQENTIVAGVPAKVIKSHPL